jgi:lipid-A-disaccharide synthase
MQSEWAGRSIVSRTFWHLSWFGNLLLTVHALIQVQYFICLIQAGNVVISWRNLNLMQSNKYSHKVVLYALIAVFIGISTLFILQSVWLFDEWYAFLHGPRWSESTVVAPIWHTLGLMSYALFSSRFWIQWWLSEKRQKSHLSASFWWLSLIGALLSSAYFALIHDIVNLLGPLIGIVPYVRNLMLLRKA